MTSTRMHSYSLWNQIQKRIKLIIHRKQVSFHRFYYDFFFYLDPNTILYLLPVDIIYIEEIQNENLRSHYVVLCFIEWILPF